jgi:tRNA A-37 threonylcarbamoyl transferase component Bud32/tetratricopeptide (TPR) repeat protein
MGHPGVASPHRLCRRAACIAVTVCSIMLVHANGARAERVVVADFHGEADMRDTAGAVTLLVRSMLGGGAEVVSRADLTAALPPGTQPGDRVDELLAATRATVLVVGDVSRRGTQLRASARVLRPGGGGGATASAVAGDGDLHGLALALARQLAPDLAAEVTDRPGACLGRLRRFAAADAALRAGDVGGAAGHIDVADALAGGRVPAAREVATAIAADTRQPLPVRIQAALVAVDPDGALALCKQALAADPKDAAAAVGAARAHLAHMNVQGAAAALAPLGDADDPLVLAARAELAHARTRFDERDALLTRALAAAPDVHVLAAIADLPIGSLAPAVDISALTVAEGIDPAFLRVRAAIGLRVAVAKPAGLDLARALVLVSVPELDDSEVDLLRPLVAAAPDGPETHRLRAELAIRAGDSATAGKEAAAWLKSRPASAAAQVMIGRLHAQAGRAAKAADAFGEALAAGEEGVRREQALALVAAGNINAARAALVRLEDPASVDARIISGLALLTEAKTDEAVAELERAVALSPASAEAHRSLARALDRAGRSDGGPHRALADALDRAAGVKSTDARPDAAGKRPAADAGDGASEDQGFLGGAMTIATGASVLALLVAGFVWVRRRRRSRDALAPAATTATTAAASRPRSAARRTQPGAVEPPRSVSTPLSQPSLDLADIDVAVLRRGVSQNGASVWIDGLGRPAYTGADGHVTLRVAPGTHTLCVDSAGSTLRRPLEVATAAPQSISVDVDAVSKVDYSAGIDVEPDASFDLEIERSPERPTTGKMSKLADGSAPGAAMETFGKYDIVAELGRGAMGVVFRAHDRNLDRDVALKLIGAEVRNHPMALEMFLHEAKALAQLNHPNIVSVYDQNEHDGLHYMVMEFVEGRTLESILAERGRLALAEVLDIADQVASGLAYAHERRVIHRDIKPANIFVGNDGSVKLGDFGLARVMREISIRKTEVRGTPLYMAPEQITGTDVNHRADLYALGCTMFEMCTGRPPFIDGDLLYHHLNTEPPHPADLSDEVPRELDALIVHCIAKDTAARIASATEIRDRLRPIRNRYG